MTACTECGATHSDACTYALCPRRKLAPVKKNNSFHAIKVTQP